ncbi:hypothetical protein [Photobacterium sp. GSS17]|uniref:hypothetical protein n=1 Tax=Photobacterium sp. GSS17 TaxID=3020715 RepID=UPI00235F4B91|nr:hypothetical protein [Photobacterium sp. GSS17]
MNRLFSKQQWLSMLFCLSLVSLSAYISHLALPGYDFVGHHPTIDSELTELRRQEESRRQQDTSALSEQHADFGWLSQPITPPSQPVFSDFRAPSFSDSESAPLLECRRTRTMQWRLAASKVVLIPEILHPHLIDNHHLGGWKSSNLQFRHRDWRFTTT